MAALDVQACSGRAALANTGKSDAKKGEARKCSRSILTVESESWSVRSQLARLRHRQHEGSSVETCIAFCSYCRRHKDLQHGYIFFRSPALRVLG